MSNFLRKVFSPYPTTLRDEDTKNWSDAVGRKAHILSGLARLVNELVFGESADPDDGGAAINPDGEVGANHSGPPWGTALRHPIAVWGGGDDDLAAWDRKERITVDSVKTGRLVERIWVRPHARWPGAPYSRGYVFVRAKASAGTPTLTVTCRRRGRDSDDVVRSRDFVTSTSAADFSHSSLYIDLEPGFVEFEIEMRGDAPTDIEIVTVEVAQIAKRSH